MSTQNYMIGVDIGTTSTKAVLFKENGEVVAKAGGEYPSPPLLPLRRSKIRSKSFRLSFPLFRGHDGERDRSCSSSIRFFQRGHAQRHRR